MNHPLNDAREFVASIVHAPDTHLDVIALVSAVTHCTDAFWTVPRVLFTADEPESGKSTALGTLALLSNNPWSATNATGPALRARFNQPEKPTVLFDEAQSVFGKDGRNNGGKEIGAVARDGYHKDAILSFSSGRVPEDVSIYCVVAFAGLRTAVPADVLTRSIRLPLKAAPRGTRLKAVQAESVRGEGIKLAQSMHAWMRSDKSELNRVFVNLPQIHEKLTGRKRQIWSPLFAVAMIAGGDWPWRCLAAFKALALDEADQHVYTVPEMIVRDAAAYVDALDMPALSSRVLVNHLQSNSDESFYRTCSESELFAYCARALGAPIVVKIDGKATRAWRTEVIAKLGRELAAHVNRQDVDSIVESDPFAVSDDDVVEDL